VDGRLEHLPPGVGDTHGASALSRGEGGIPEGRVDRLPAAEDVSIPVQANLIIELCSK
jgi:hypothetical protein